VLQGCGSLRSSYRRRSGQKESAHRERYCFKNGLLPFLQQSNPGRFCARQDLHMARRHPRPPEEDPKAILAAAVARAEETTAIKVRVAAKLSRIETLPRNVVIRIRL
jgi:hypothetical protein